MTSMHRRGVEPLSLSIWQSLHTERHLELQFKTQIFPLLFLTNLLAAYLQWDCASLFGRWFHLISLSPRSSAQCSIQDTHLRNKRHALQAVPLVQTYCPASTCTPAWPRARLFTAAVLLRQRWTLKPLPPANAFPEPVPKGKGSTGKEPPRPRAEKSQHKALLLQ